MGILEKEIRVNKYFILFIILFIFFTFLTLSVGPLEEYHEEVGINIFYTPDGTMLDVILDSLAIFFLAPGTQLLLVVALPSIFLLGEWRSLWIIFPLYYIIHALIWSVIVIIFIYILKSPKKFLAKVLHRKDYGSKITLFIIIFILTFIVNSFLNYVTIQRQSGQLWVPELASGSLIESTILFYIASRFKLSSYRLIVKNEKNIL